MSGCHHICLIEVVSKMRDASKLLVSLLFPFNINQTNVSLPNKKTHPCGFLQPDVKAIAYLTRLLWPLPPGVWVSSLPGTLKKKKKKKKKKKNEFRKAIWTEAPRTGQSQIRRLFGSSYHRPPSSAVICSNPHVTSCGWTHSISHKQPWLEPLFVGISRGIIIAGCLQQCRIVHPQYV